MAVDSRLLFTPTPHCSSIDIEQLQTNSVRRDTEASRYVRSAERKIPFVPSLSVERASRRITLYACQSAVHKFANEDYGRGCRLYHELIPSYPPWITGMAELHRDFIIPALLISLHVTVLLKAIKLICSLIIVTRGSSPIKGNLRSSRFSNLSRYIAFLLSSLR